MPLDEVLQQVKDFLDTHPTEIVSISIRNDNFTINLDANTQSTELVKQLDIFDKYYRDDIFQYVFNFFGGTDLFIRDINDNTTVKELQKANKRIFLIVQYYSYAKSELFPADGIYELSSWKASIDSDVRRNH